MNKYGSAEHVVKRDGKAVISEKELPKDELEKAASGLLKKRKIVVTDEDYRSEDDDKGA